MLNKKVFFLVAITALLFMAACSNDKKAGSDEAGKDVEISESENFNETGMPIVDEPITLNFMAGKSSLSADDYNETLLWKTYNEMSGIDIEWELVPSEGRDEKRNLALASESLPDVFYTMSLPNNDLLKYGEQGVFIELNDLIEEYMPNLTQILEENPEIKKGITFPEGEIFGLPTIYDPDFPSLLVGSKLWIKEDWLEQLDMDMPQTTDEFYSYLKGVKETDLNGNGKADEIPFGGTAIGPLREWLTGSFGVQNRGRNHAYLDVDPETEEMRFFPISEEYKELLEYMNTLFSEGLIDESIYTIEASQSYSIGSEGLYGSTVITSTETIYGEEGKGYIGMPALEGPHGDRQFTKIGSPLSRIGGMAITSENKYVPETLRWMDYFYSDEGSKLFFMGVEGETFEVTEDGGLDYLDEIKNSADGLTLEQELSKYITWLGGGYPGIVKEEFFSGAESLPSSIEAAEQVEPYVIDEIWAPFTYTNEEEKTLSPIQADLHKYVDEMQDKFITGATSFSEWDQYIETVNKMNLEAYLEINQTALERFESN